MNYLSPELRDAPWTLEEDLFLIRKQRELGAKWVQLAKYFPNRTDAMVKNRFNRLKRRERKQFELLTQHDPRMLSFFCPGYTTPASAPEIPSQPLPIGTPDFVEPTRPETVETSVWEEIFPLDDCFLDVFSWV
jgi:hypothetical protein